MKKIYSFVLLAVTLLLSTNLWAESTWMGTAKLNGGDTKPIADLISDWQTNGGTLQLQSECTYTTDATFDVTGTNTLDLNGQKLTWNLTSSEQSPVAINLAGDVAITNGNIYVTMKGGNFPVFIMVNNSSAKLQMEGVKIGIDIEATKYGKVVRNDNGGIALKDVAISMEGSIQAAIYTQSYGVITQCKNVTIDAKDITGTASTVFGMNIGTATEIKVEDVTIDLSNVDEQKSAEAIRFVLPTDVTENRFVFGSGTLTSNSNSDSYAVRIWRKKTTLVIEGGKFSKMPDKGSGTLTIPAGKAFAKVGEYYELVGEGLVGIIGTTPYTTFDALWAACPDGVQTSVTLLNEGKTDAITIPANKNILLSIGVPAQEYNITNNGIVTLNSTMVGTFTNGATGKLSVIGGTFAAKEYNAFVKGNEANGYMSYQTDASATAYKVFKKGSVAAVVNYVMYEYLQEALNQSSAKYPAQIICDYEVKGKRDNLSFKLVDGVDAYLDLGGYTLTLPVEYGVELQNAHLTISMGTLNCTQSSAIDLIGSADPTAQNYTTLTINSDVTIKQSQGKEYFVSISEHSESNPYGVVVNFNGTYEGQVPFYIYGTVKTISDNAPTFNIGSTANFTSNSLAYAAGYGIWNYAGEATTTHHGFELRAGKLNVTGGKIVCTSDAPADDQGNGSGSTSQASAIAACQHSTKLPVEINISGGEFEAYTPLYQANTEKNPQEAYDKVKVTVTGGKFKATKGSKNVVWSENKKIALEGGLYNMNPSAYAASGKVAVANTDDATNAEYPWTIDNVETEGATFTTAGNWDVQGNWQDAKMATSKTPVSISADVTIPAGVTAEAYKITVAWDKTITIKSGATLIVGAGGINIAGNQAKQLVIEDGASLLINPATTTNNQPMASVVRTMNTQKKTTTIEEGESPYVRYYMGIPTIGKPTINSNGIQLYARDWDIIRGWKDATEFATSFKGYGVTSEELNEQSTFSGQLIGNVDAALTMPRSGFYFFANSWMASVDMKEVLNQLDQLKNNGSVEAAVTVWVEEGKYQSITRAQLPMYPYWEQIAPLKTFFLHANAATSIILSYEKAAWNAQLAKKSAAPKRMIAADEETAVRIKLIAANGRQDNVYVRENEEFYATKMMNTKPNVNIFVEANENNYAEFANEDLEGTVIGIQTNSQTNYSLAFDFVKGETLCIKDLQTGVVTAMTEGNVYKFTATANETSRRFIISRHNAPTATDEVMVNTAAKGVYSITGQYLGENSALETLPQGIYVVDGQKYIK